MRRYGNTHFSTYSWPICASAVEAHMGPIHHDISKMCTISQSEHSITTRNHWSRTFEFMLLSPSINFVEFLVLTFMTQKLHCRKKIYVCHEMLKDFCLSAGLKRPFQPGVTESTFSNPFDFKTNRTRTERTDIRNLNPNFCPHFWVLFYSSWLLTTNSMTCISKSTNTRQASKVLVLSQLTAFPYIEIRIRAT
jgi:hypothetical protein